MIVNKYILLLLGLVINIFIAIFLPIYTCILWSVSFWLWYSNLKDSKGENKSE